MKYRHKNLYVGILASFLMSTSSFGMDHTEMPCVSYEESQSVTVSKLREYVFKGLKKDGYESALLQMSKPLYKKRALLKTLLFPFGPAQGSAHGCHGYLRKY